MRRWVIQTEDGLQIVGTGGNEPINCVCEAKDHWTHDSIYIDRGVVHYKQPKEIVPEPVFHVEQISGK